MTPEDKKIWDEVAKTVKPLKKKDRVCPEKEAKKTSNVSIDKENSGQKKTLQFNTPSPHFEPSIRADQDRILSRKLRQGTYHIEATLDLHGQTQDEAYESLQRFLARAIERRFKLVLIITGKGSRRSFGTQEACEDSSLGVLRQKVPEWLSRTVQFPGVLSVSPARPQDGGGGAFYVTLRSR